jgi:hypothetical protein
VQKFQPGVSKIEFYFVEQAVFAKQKIDKIMMLVNMRGIAINNNFRTYKPKMP